MNPEDIAAARFKEIAKAREQIAKIEAALAKSRELHEELQRKLVTAEVRDRQALGQALVDGKAEPESRSRAGEGGTSPTGRTYGGACCCLRDCEQGDS